MRTFIRRKKEFIGFSMTPLPGLFNKQRVGLLQVAEKGSSVHPSSFVNLLLFGPVVRLLYCEPSPILPFEPRLLQSTQRKQIMETQPAILD